MDAARRLFPGAPEPFLDLSTGINPNPYPIPTLAPHLFTQLPQAGALAALAARAAQAYGAPSESNVVPACGIYQLVSAVAQSVAPGPARVVGPTYAEHARALRIAGHEVETVNDLSALGSAALGVVVNPNNPDGRVFGKADLLAVAERQSASGGLLIVDEAFMDVGPCDESLADAIGDEHIIVLRSFGKVFGLAGLRLSFVLAASSTAMRLRAMLGPWPVSGPAIAIGTEALSDTTWIANTCAGLTDASRRLDALLGDAGLKRVGGTLLFTLLESDEAPQIFDRLGRAGILVRRFVEAPTWLRFGLPGCESDWQRLETALRHR